jgi:hypothetical protein
VTRFRHVLLALDPEASRPKREAIAGGYDRPARVCPNRAQRRYGVSLKKGLATGFVLAPRED